MTGSGCATIEAIGPPPGEPEKPRAQIAMLVHDTALAPSPVRAEFDLIGPARDFPPPLIEPVGFDDALQTRDDSPQASRPPRRSFLAPLVDSAGETSGRRAADACAAAGLARPQ